MAGLSLSGLASGMDWKSIVSQLMTLERAPQDKMKTRVSDLAKRQSAFNDIKTSLLSFQSAAKSLSFGSGTTSPRAASMVGTTTDASVTTANAATMGTFQVTVGGNASGSSLLSGTGSANTGLASNSVLLGKAASSSFQLADPATLMSKKLSDYGVTAGTVTIGGTQITITSSDLSKTVAQFFSDGTDLSTSHSTSGYINGTALASPDDWLQVSQDATTGAIQLSSSNVSTPQSIGSAGDTSNILSALGLAQTSASPNLKFTQTVPAKMVGATTLSTLATSAGVTWGTTGGFKINGVEISGFASTATLNEVVGKINATPSTGVKASIDPVLQRLVLTSTSPGRLGITVSASSTSDTDMRAALGLAQGTGAALTEWTPYAVSSGSGTTITLSGTTSIPTAGYITGPGIPAGTTFTSDGSSVVTLSNGLSTSLSSGSSIKLFSKAAPATSTAEKEGSFVRGQALEFNLRYNGRLITDSTGNALLTSDSNTIDLSKYGFGGTKITVAPSTDISSLTTPATYTAVVSGAASQARQKIDDFIKAFNSLSQLVIQNTKTTVGVGGKVTTSILTDSRDMVSLPNAIRTLVYKQIADSSNSSINGSYDTIWKIGLDFDKSGVLSVKDAALLDKALTSAPEAVDALLNATGTSTNSATQGLGVRISTLVDSMTASAGFFSSITSSINAQTNRLNNQISEMDVRFTAKQKQLTDSFIKMESAQQKMQSQSSALTQAFSSSTSK